MQQACVRIFRFVHGKDLAAYLADDLTRSAVERQFEIAGEALARLAKDNPALADRVPDYRQVIAFRNVLIHGYAAPDDVRVWRAIESDLPDLKTAVDELLSSLGEAPYP